MPAAREYKAEGSGLREPLACRECDQWVAGMSRLLGGSVRSSASSVGCSLPALRSLLLVISLSSCEQRIHTQATVLLCCPACPAQQARITCHAGRPPTAGRTGSTMGSTAEWQYIAVPRPLWNWWYCSARLKPSWFESSTHTVLNSSPSVGAPLQEGGKAAGGMSGPKAGQGGQRDWEIARKGQHTRGSQPCSIPAPTATPCCIRGPGLGRRSSGAAAVGACARQRQLEQGAAGRQAGRQTRCN